MILGIPREIYPKERRVAMVPAVIPNLKKAGLEVLVEAGAGQAAGYPDKEYVEKARSWQPIAPRFSARPTSSSSFCATARTTKTETWTCRYFAKARC